MLPDNHSCEPGLKQGCKKGGGDLFAECQLSALALAPVITQPV